MHEDRSISVPAIAVIGFVVLCAVVLVGMGVQDEPAERASEAASHALADNGNQSKPKDEPEAPHRVILRVNRNQSIMGFLKLEDDDVIVIRTLRGEVQSFPKVRVLQIVRLVEPEPGQSGVVILNNGQRREGIIIEDTFEHVLVEIEGIPAKLRREFVDYVVLEPTFEQRYQQYRANLRPHMIEHHLTLCRWLIQERRYDLAHENLKEILAEREHHEAQRLLHIVDAQLALQAKAATRTEDSSIESDRDGSLDEDPERLPPRLLTHDEVNLMRVYEVDFDNPPRLTVQPATVRRLFENYGTHEAVPATQSERNAMMRGDASRIVRLMFELRARELYPEIQVGSEPHSLNLFRLRVHNTWLLNSCATSGCHGGPDAGDLYLHRANHTDERVRYTNFMILERLEVDPQWPLINYTDPEMSLIVQYGLPRESARLPHPEVRGWAPVFGRPNDRMKQETIRWIESMMQPRPVYPIDFDPLPQDIVPAGLAEKLEPIAEPEAIAEPGT